MQNYPHATFTLYGSTVNWTGNVRFFDNKAKLRGTVGIQSIIQLITVSGNISFVSNHADFSAGFFMSHTIVRLDGTLIIVNNSALVAASGLTLLSSTLHVNGIVHISGNTVASEISAIVVVQNQSNFDVTGSFEFVNNIALNRAFCILIAFSHCYFNGSTTIAGSTGNRPLHYFQNSDIVFAGTTKVTKNIVRNNYGGGLGLSQSNLRLNDNYLFEDNQAPDGDGGAIYAIDSSIHFDGKGNFTGNSARRGGALYIFYQSRLILQPNSFAAFTRNTALTGAAIHVEEIVSFINCTNDIRLRNVYAERPTCFFDAELVENIILQFVGNKAQIGGTALYGGMLDRCIPSIQNVSALNLFTNISKFSDLDIELSLSSDPFQLCFCENDQPVCDTEQQNVTTMRGGEFSVSVAVRNELDVSIVALVRSYLDSSYNNTDKILEDDGILQRVDNSCTELKFRVSSPSEIEQLIMYVEGPCRDVGNASKTVNVHFTDCPIGFMLNFDTCACVLQLIPYTNTCNVDTGEIERPSNFWVGPDYNDSGHFTGLALYPNCPFDYCQFPSAPVTLTSPDMQCNYNRTGILCGSCGVNTSLLLGGSACAKCSNYYLFGCYCLLLWVFC